MICSCVKIGIGKYKLFNILRCEGLILKLSIDKVLRKEHFQIMLFLNPVSFYEHHKKGFGTVIMEKIFETNFRLHVK